MNVTKNLSVYVAEKGINLSVLSRATGIKRGVLHKSLSGAVADEKRRPLKGEELIKICRFLDVDPLKFDDAPDGGAFGQTTKNQ